MMDYLKFLKGEVGNSEIEKKTINEIKGGWREIT